jgi:hypothetical protein
LVGRWSDRPTDAVFRYRLIWSPALAECLAEALIPPQHRRPDALDEKYRLLCRIAERLRAELHAVDLDHPFGHVARSLLADRM